MVDHPAVQATASPKRGNPLVKLFSGNYIVIVLAGDNK